MKLQLFIVFFFANISCINSLNTRPIIGIMTQELSGTFVPNKKSFILTNYVKFLEASGARVVPIFIYKSREYYEAILKKINGVLFPGGGDVWDSKGYGRTGKIIFEIATKMNDEGDHFPLWGTCLGFELLNFVAANKAWMKACNAMDMATNIEFVHGYNYSRMFSKLPEELKMKMISEKVALHLHNWCFTLENYTLSGLDLYFRVLTLNKDMKNVTFVSIVEAYRYPFYGISFHPERVLFDWTVRKAPTPRSLDAVIVSQYFGNFFVNEARKNDHHFPTQEEEISSLIYNYNPEIAGSEPSQQMYTFQ